MAKLKNKPAGTTRGSVSLTERPAQSGGLPSDLPGQREDSGSGIREAAVAEKEKVIVLEEPVVETAEEAAVAEKEKVETPTEEVQEFPVKLVNPSGKAFKPYGDAAQDFQRKIIASKIPVIEALTITKLTVPTVDAPEVHITPYCGFPVVKGDAFTVQLSDGTVIAS